MPQSRARVVTANDRVTVTAVRVPGGCLYVTRDLSVGVHSVFVPTSQLPLDFIRWIEEGES